MLEDIYQLSRNFLKLKDAPYRRYFIKTTSLAHRLSILVGQRGIGKTTTLIQYLLDYVDADHLSNKILYVQADHFLLANASLYEISEQFQAMGGEFIAFDEIHKYSNWSSELKSIYDTFPKLKILASGSSALEIYKGSHDLSRRSVVYTMQGLSFREYLELYLRLTLPNYSLTEILNNHERIVLPILNSLEEANHKILPQFIDYLQYGYYPYFKEIGDHAIYYMTLEQNLHVTLESDLVAIYPFLKGDSIRKLKNLLMFIAGAVPFIPNWQKLKSILEIGDERTLKTYFSYLEKAGLIQTIAKSSVKLSKLEVPDKIYLNNSNQLYAISAGKQNIGTVRETFFLNMLSSIHDVTLPMNGDFLVDNQYLFEVGGRKKGFNQIKNQNHAYVACDDIETGIGGKIPLWLFGFLY